MMKTAMRPVAYTRNVSVLYRIEMNVIDVAFKISLIANGMFPISSLPYPLFPLGCFALRSRLCRIKTSRKSAFDQTPAGGKICVAIRQFPYRMEMIGQNANCDGFKGPRC